jgi:hypothetical protein
MPSRTRRISDGEAALTSLDSRGLEDTLKGCAEAVVPMRFDVIPVIAHPSFKNGVNSSKPDRQSTSARTLIDDKVAQDQRVHLTGRVGVKRIRWRRDDRLSLQVERGV